MDLRPRRTGTAVGVVAMVLLYLLLAPAACGGPVTYARVAGSSMVPRLQPGDLVFARKADSYHMGDVVAYHNPDLGLVMHRIIVDNGDRVIVKGDANSWVDSYQPKKSEIAGRLWLRIPHGAALLSWLKPPWATLIFTALAIAVITVPMLRRRPPGAPRVGWSGGRAGTLWNARASRAFTMYSSAGSLIALASLVIGMLAVVLAVVAYSRPPLRTRSEEHEYTQQAHFVYQAAAPAGLYDAATIHEGDPVFLKLTRAVDMAVHFGIDAPDRMATPTGTIGLTATLQQQNGWERTMVLAPPTPFTGFEATAAGTLDLAAFRRMVDDAEAASGVHFESYQLVVRADIRSTAGADLPLRPFEPQVVFRISATQLQLEQTPNGERSPLTLSSAGTYHTAYVEPDHLSLPGWSPAVAGVRFWAPVLAVLAFAVLAVLTRFTVASMTGDQARRIEAQYGDLVLQAHLLQSPPGLTLVRMQSFEDLARLARAAGLPVLRCGDAPPDFMLITPEAAYHYEAREQERPSAVTARIAQRLGRQAA